MGRGWHGARRRLWLAAAVLAAGAAGLVLLGGAGASPGVALRASFAADGGDATFVSEDSFWSSEDRGLSENDAWLAESGELRRTGASARTTSPLFRMWSRRTDLAFSSVEVDLRFDGFAGGTEGWHGVNLWLNRSLCAPVPSCSALDDGGSSGYALDFVNRDGSLMILKLVPGDTRQRWPDDQIGFTQGGTYYVLAARTWTPEVGRRYRFAGSVTDDGSGSSTLRITVDGEVLLEAVDDGTVAGPRLEGGRVGLRSDYADLTVDDLVVRR